MKQFEKSLSLTQRHTPLHEHLFISSLNCRRKPFYYKLFIYKSNPDGTFNKSNLQPLYNEIE